LTASWNAWIDAQDEKTTMAEVPVHRLEHWMEDQYYMVCPAGTGKQLKRRESLLNVMGSTRLEKMDGEADFWKQTAEHRSLISTHSNRPSSPSDSDTSMG
jgi:hypothetical protein